MLGVDLMHRRSRSLAFVSVQSPWMEAPDSRKTRAPWRLDSYGGDAAAGELERLLGEWEAMQAAGRQALRIVASGSGEVLRLRFRWERP